MWAPRFLRPESVSASGSPDIWNQPMGTRTELRFPPETPFWGGRAKPSFATHLKPLRLALPSDAFFSSVIKGFGALNSGLVPVPTPRLVCDRGAEGGCSSGARWRPGDEGRPPSRGRACRSVCWDSGRMPVARSGLMGAPCCPPPGRWGQSPGSQDARPQSCGRRLSGAL